MKLNTAQLYELVRRHHAEPFLDRIMVAAALTESGGETTAEGDHGHSCGLWQLHDQGLGVGMSKADRFDPDKSCERILPEFRRVFRRWQTAGRTGEDLAVRTYLWTERPFDFQNLDSAAARRFREQWSLSGEPGAALTMADLAQANPSIVHQRATWGQLRQGAGEDPNDWAAFRQFQIDIGAPDPGPREPSDFPITSVAPRTRGLTLATLATELPNPSIRDQATTWQALRRRGGEDPNDWAAFGQFQIAIGAPDPGPREPVDFRTR